MSIINKLNVFHTLPPLVVQPGTTLSGYLINTNGLKPTTIRTKCSLPSGYKRDKIRDLYMFVVSGHLYRPLLLSQSWELGGKILGGFGTHPPTFFGAGLSILVFF